MAQLSLDMCDISANFANFHLMIVLGIDPGSYTTGFAILEKKEKVQVLNYGAIVCKRSEPPENRLLYIITELETLLKTYKPQVLSMEGVFFAKNPQSALLLGMVRGAILVCCRRHGLEYVEYSPRSVKMAITGNGAASKEQVAQMVKALLHVKELEGPLDASDALAIAWTHLSPPPLLSMLPKKKKGKSKKNAMKDLAIRMGAIIP